MTHICYVYIESYRRLKQVELVIDHHYEYTLDPKEKSLLIEKKSCLPDDFWGVGIYSLAAIVGGNGVGKSTSLSFILNSVVEGVGNRDFQGCVIFENNGALYINSMKCGIDVVGCNGIEITYVERNINTFYYSGHFSASYDIADLRTIELSGLYNATDCFRLIKDLQDYSNIDTLQLMNDIKSHITAYQSQNHYRICQLLSIKQKRETLGDINFPKYIIISPNMSGINAIQLDSIGKFKNFNIPRFTKGNKNAKDRMLAYLLYCNLINVFVDQDSVRNEAFDFLKKWCITYTEETCDILNVFQCFVDKEQNGSLKVFFDNICWCLTKLDEICQFDEDQGLYYVNVEDDNDRLNQLTERLLGSRMFLTAKFFDMHYSHNLSSITTLSSGEQELLNLFSRIYYAVVVGPGKYQNLVSPSLVLLDEAEIGFHPEWQRQYVKQICDFIHHLEVKAGHDFQIILTSHSPIILSDIPKCCVNFLKNDGNGHIVNCREEQSETFAENVYNLYRQSFFMQNGLIGAFASEKIEKLKIKIEKCHSRKDMDRLRGEINYIGDAFIKGYLLNRLDNVSDQLSDDEQIALYQEKIEELRRRKDE